MHARMHACMRAERGGGGRRAWSVWGGSRVSTKPEAPPQIHTPSTHFHSRAHNTHLQVAPLLLRLTRLRLNQFQEVQGVRLWVLCGLRVWGGGIERCDGSVYILLVRQPDASDRPERESLSRARSIDRSVQWAAAARPLRDSQPPPVLVGRPPHEHRRTAATSHNRNKRMPPLASLPLWPPGPTDRSTHPCRSIDRTKANTDTDTMQQHVPSCPSPPWPRPRATTPRGSW